jgi:hypothetical protein
VIDQTRIFCGFTENEQNDKHIGKSDLMIEENSALDMRAGGRSAFHDWHHISVGHFPDKDFRNVVGR